jgi:hypothetical protein
MRPPDRLKNKYFLFGLIIQLIFQELQRINTKMSMEQVQPQRRIIQVQPQLQIIQVQILAQIKSQKSKEKGQPTHQRSQW